MAQRAYEAMVILNPEMGEEELTAATQRISDQIGARGEVEKVFEGLGIEAASVHKRWERIRVGKKANAAAMVDDGAAQ